MALRTAAVVALVWCGAAAVAADTYPRQPGIDAEHYVFRLALDDTKPSIAGEATVRFRFPAASVTSLWLDLASPAAGKGMTVSSVTSGGTAVSYKHGENRLTLALGTAPAAGDRREFTIKYEGVPANGLRLIQNKYSEWSAFSENWPNRARHWLPMVDHPYDKATSEFIVTTADRYQVVANGRLIEELDLPGGLRRTHWKQSAPIASWLNAVGIADFAVHHAGDIDGIPLQSWVFPQDRERGYAVFEETSRRAMRFFTARIGPYPYEKLANVQAAGLGGATEHASAIFYGEKGVAAGRAPVVHEIAHQWFGNAVTERDWDDVWLSEGFATYFTLLFTEHDEGRDAFVEGLMRSRQTILDLERRQPDTPVIHRNLSEMRRVLNQFVYQKGGWFLHMLRGRIGTEAFWAGIRAYYGKFRDLNASTAEFRAEMERASGVDLRELFDQWLTRSGVPKLEGSWHYDAARKVVEVTLTQAQAAPPYRLSVGIGIVPAAGARPRLQSIEMLGRDAKAAFPAEAAPVDVLLDPETWLLVEGTIKKQ
jgi:aminopeptidase N